MPASANEIADVFGYAAMAITVVYFLSPVPTCAKIIKARDAQLFSPVTYIVMLFNTLLWVYFAEITMAVTSQDLTPNLLVNATGAVLSGTYVTVFLAFARHRLRVLWQVSGAAAFVGGLILFFELAVPRLRWDFHWGSGMPLKPSICGLVTDVINVVMYGSPLVVLRMVIRTKSVKYMPLPVSLFTFLASSLWAAQGVLLGNLTVLLPNVLGVALGIVQLALYAVFCNRQPIAGDVENCDARVGLAPEPDICDAQARNLANES